MADGISVSSYVVEMVSPEVPRVAEFGRLSAVLPMMIWLPLKSVTELSRAALSSLYVTVGDVAHVADAGSGEVIELSWPSALYPQPGVLLAPLGAEVRSP